MKELKVLIALAKRGALDKNITIKTVDLGKEIKIPQQTISRLLIKLTKSSLIIRVKGIRGYIIKITPLGKNLLRDMNFDLNEIFKKNKEIEIKGKVVDGLKDGKYYLSLEEYKKNIKKELGFEPYPGTLNIILTDAGSIEAKERLQRMNGVMIEGFKRGNRVFGSIKCFKCNIDGIEASIIIPERSHYGSEIVELISPLELRKRMKLKSGDEIIVRLAENENQ
jgi:riboflavin kinase